VTFPNLFWQTLSQGLQGLEGSLMGTCLKGGLLQIVGFRGLNGNGPLLPQNPLEMAGGFAPHLVQWVLW
jgi:hypothetical protein